MFDTIIQQGIVVLADQYITADLGIKDGKIAHIAPHIDAAQARKVVDATGCYVLPGMVDVHMHISEPGRTEWEGYETGTQAMAAGGTTSFVEMPLNTMPATTDVESLNVKLKAAQGKSYVDYSPMGGLVPWNLQDLPRLSEAGVAAYKCFVATCGSGKPGDFKNVDDYELYVGMQALAKTDDLLVIHCENAALTDKLGAAAKAAGKTKVSDYVATRPVFTEVEAVRRVLLLAKETGCRVHIAHCSCPEAIEAVFEAQAQGVDASFESCPHYFLLATEDLDAIGPRAKCSPPIRDRNNQARMWDQSTSWTRRMRFTAISFWPPKSSPTPMRPCPSTSRPPTRCSGSFPTWGRRRPTRWSSPTPGRSPTWWSLSSCCPRTSSRRALKTPRRSSTPWCGTRSTGSTARIRRS